jgi:CRP/FNR family transcriptional regulator
VDIPQPTFERALASPGFREFVFASYGERVASLVMLIDAVAFGRMDRRLAQTLLKLADGSGRVVVTHRDLARELGTAREVVSRLLKEFGRRGLVALQRGLVELRKPAELADYD